MAAGPPFEAWLVPYFIKKRSAFSHLRGLHSLGTYSLGDPTCVHCYFSNALMTGIVYFVGELLLHAKTQHHNNLTQASIPESIVDHCSSCIVSDCAWFMESDAPRLHHQILTRLWFVTNILRIWHKVGLDPEIYQFYKSIGHFQHQLHLPIHHGNAHT